MAQFTLYRNINKQSREAFPYLLDAQQPLLEDLHTRVVIPVARLSDMTGQPISHLCPVIEHNGEKVVLYSQQLAAISMKELGEQVGDMQQYRSEIIAALDFLFTGI